MPALSFALQSFTSLLAMSLLQSPVSALPVDSRSNNLETSLFPLGHYPSSSSSFTTSTSLPTRFSLTSALPILEGRKPTSSNSPTGQNAFEAFYPSGSINPGNAVAPHGGFSFYSAGPSWGTSSSKGPVSTWQANLASAKEVTFGYSVYFEEGFEYNMGGKLPGLFGGVGMDEAVGCSGGRQEGRDDCFSVRMMWRTNGAGEAYNYLPTSVNQPASYCTTAPYSECNPKYGDSIGRGAFYFHSGQWNTIAQRVKLNDIGVANGEIEIFFNGESVIQVSGIIIRTQASSVFQGIQAQTFFGGSSTPWASPKDQFAWFKDWSMAVLA